METLVLGMGNLLLGDEGVGVHAARALAQERLPPSVTIMDIGTAVLDALPALEKASCVIVVDAMKAGKAPGTVYRIPFSECARSENIGSMHGFDLSRVLALAQREDPPEVVIVGIEPETIAWSLDLSAEVLRALPTVLHAVRDEIQRNGAPSVTTAERR